MEPVTIKLTLDAETALQLQLHKPRSLATATFCALLVEQGLKDLTGGLEYPRTVSVREKVGNLPTKAKPPSEARAVQPTLPAKPSRTDIPPIDGVGVGRESEGTPRRGDLKRKAENPAETPFHPTGAKDFKPPVVDHDYSALLPAMNDLFEFWAAKSGKITQRAWKGLLRECEKIRADGAGGMAVLKQEITKSAERGQQGIDHSRWLAYGVNRFAKGATAAQPEQKHPASRVFTAARGFDDEPVTNPVLKGMI